MVTLIVPNINRFLPPSTFPRGVRFFYRMELLAIPQVPLWSFSGGRRSRSFRDGQHSLQIWILLSISGKEWRRKPFMPSSTSDFINKLYDSAKLDGNCSAGQRNPDKILFTSLLVHDEILDRFLICYFIYFLRKIKCIYYNLIDYYYLRQDFCSGRNWQCSSLSSNKPHKHLFLFW